MSMVIANCSTTLGWFGGRKRSPNDHRYIKPGDVLMVREDLEELLPELNTDDQRIAVMTAEGHTGWLFADEVDLEQDEEEKT